jgi:hypothetical protein
MTNATTGTCVVIYLNEKIRRDRFHKTSPPNIKQNTTTEDLQLWSQSTVKICEHFEKTQYLHLEGQTSHEEAFRGFRHSLRCLFIQCTDNSRMFLWNDKMLPDYTGPKDSNLYSLYSDSLKCHFMKTCGRTWLRQQAFLQHFVADATKRVDRGTCVVETDVTRREKIWSLYKTKNCE